MVKLKGIVLIVCLFSCTRLFAGIEEFGLVFTAMIDNDGESVEIIVENTGRDCIFILCNADEISWIYFFPKPSLSSTSRLSFGEKLNPQLTFLGNHKDGARRFTKVEIILGHNRNFEGGGELEVFFAARKPNDESAYDPAMDFYGGFRSIQVSFELSATKKSIGRIARTNPTPKQP